ncbi:hypothetical protein AOC36_08140 [Erysipelothrix larvae]|uniref:Uncharacterized protein n=1 Tax=Erysipelothrix larvae TaxID=1514105 RepID=A0A0X8H0R9_9FIRM|nr:PTS sugar transporter subunit IIA [Erysipelothrix larvae]AMC93956.1 hypothetical protein AOC36_08140 [Erysipelothrix larvae]
MNEKQTNLLNYLLHKSYPISARKIANLLNVSIRTVKNYVKEINAISGDTIIFSSNQGYWVNNYLPSETLEQLMPTTKIPQTFKERANYIIKKIAIDNLKVDVFDLTEELFVSYSTIKSDISRMNQVFDSFNLQFEISQDKIEIIGNEKEIRRLASYVIFEEIPNYFMTQEILEQNFEYEYVTKITNLIEEVLEYEDIKMNDFAFMNLLLHILVLIVSVKNGRSLISNEDIILLFKDSKANIVEEFVEKLEKEFEVILNDVEKQELYYLFQANVNFIPNVNIKKIENVIHRDIIESLNIIVGEVYQSYGIHLKSEQFFLNFAIHLSNLYHRAKNDAYLKNPMIEVLKTDFPIVYDISVYVSYRLGELLGITINDHESAYIALHIGSELEGQKKNSSKIKTAILCPNYMNHAEQLYRQLQKNFSDELNIVLVTSNPIELESADIDLLITTLKTSINLNCATIEVLPILSDEQKLHLSSKIQDMLLQRKKSILFEKFDTYFSEKYFYNNLDIEDRDELLEFMCNNLEADNIVKTQYLDKVLEREKASSTAFELFAIPHSVYMDANKTNISVAISKKGFVWGEKRVNIVLLASINYVDRYTFSSVYEAIISLFDYPELYSELWNIQSFDEFKHFIKSKM